MISRQGGQELPLYNFDESHVREQTMHFNDHHIAAI